MDNNAVDDIIAYLIDHEKTLVNMRKGEIRFGIQDGRLVTATVTKEDRVGYEIQRNNNRVQRSAP